MIPDLHDLFPSDQVDQAAATIQAFVQELGFQFESRYCAQIRRHARQQPRHCDPNQPWLFLPPGEQ